MPIRLFASQTQNSALPGASPSQILSALLSPESSGVDIRRFNLVNQPENADFILLPFNWQQSQREDLREQAAEQGALAESLGKPLIISSESDYPANAPFAKALVFERSGYASRRGQNQQKIFSLPAFINDYLQVYCEGALQIRQKSALPVVGFCGQAGGGWLHFARRRVNNWIARLSYRLGRRKWEPAPFETTWFRHQVLARFSRHQRIQTNFIIRSRYRAGYLAREKDPFHPTRLEFINNILNSDYTVCMRGGGNFSVRFYEALALGRIPIFVNTDCILPYDHLIDYRKYCVWVEADEIPRIADKVADFHARLSNQDFIDLQHACRDVWLEWLSKEGFFKHFHQHFA